MRALAVLLVGATALAGCSAVPPATTAAIDARAAAELHQLIEGKVAGPPVTCLQHYQSDRMVTIDDNTIAFRDGGTVYVNRLQGGGCNALGTGFYTLVTRNVGGTGLCSGQIAQVADLTSGTTVGSCIIGEFVPYREP